MSEDRLFKKVGAVILLVSEMEKSVKFYRDVQRLPILYINSGTVMALHTRRKAKVNPGIGVSVGFMVTDLDDIVNKLKQQGVKFFKEPKEEPFGKHTILEDPDGHLISIAQIESKSAEGFNLLGFLIDMGVDIQ